MSRKPIDRRLRVWYNVPQMGTLQSQGGNMENIMVQLRIRVPIELRDRIEALAQRRKCQDAGNLSATVRFILFEGLKTINGRDGDPPNATETSVLS